MDVVAVRLLVAGLWSKGHWVPRLRRTSGCRGYHCQKVSENEEKAASDSLNQQLVPILNQFC